MDKFYFDPLTNSRFDTMEALEKNMSKSKIRGYPVYRIQSEDCTLDCIADQDIYSIYINSLINSHIDGELLTSMIDASMPNNLDGSLEITFMDDGTTDVHLNIPDYSHLKMLDTDMLADKIYAILTGLIDKKREG